MNNININYIKNVDITDKSIFNQTRSGVIIYTIYNNTLQFILGIDTKSGNITDFGGGSKVNENVIETGLRELTEESLGVFGNITRDEIKDHIIVYNSNMAILFIHLNIEKNVFTEFEKRKNLMPYTEVNMMIRLTEDQLCNIINGKKIGGRVMYSKVRNFLKDIFNPTSDLYIVNFL